jgi:ubiquinone/menaquinone biosynthesis C-methylase UbiE
MATFLRPLSYRYPWLYNTISRLAALTVGGENRFRQLPLEGLTLTETTRILDLCCGSGQTTSLLVQYSQHVTGLDASPKALARARQNVPQATYVAGWAEAMPLENDCFDLVHSSAAMHEMTPLQLEAIFKEIFRILKPGGYFVMSDFHQPQNPLFWPGVAMFLWLFETETAWQLIQTSVPTLLQQSGFEITLIKLHAGGSLQILQAKKSL